MNNTGRQALENQIHNTKALYVWGWGAMILLSRNEAPAVLRDSYLMVGERKQEFVGMANALTDPDKKQEIMSEFHKVFLRSYIRESFELIKDYCKETDQLRLLKDQPWYHFARLVRNCMAHNFKWKFNEDDKKLLPLTLRALTITADMEDKPLMLEFFNHTHAWNLHTDMSLFVKNIIK